MGRPQARPPLPRTPSSQTGLVPSSSPLGSKASRSPWGLLICRAPTPPPVVPPENCDRKPLAGLKPHYPTKTAGGAGGLNSRHIINAAAFPPLTYRFRKQRPKGKVGIQSPASSASHTLAPFLSPRPWTGSPCTESPPTTSRPPQPARPRHPRRRESVTGGVWPCILGAH